MTLANIERKHVLRNPLVANYLYDIFYIEKWGPGVARFGIARMRRLMREHGLAEPHLEDLSDFFAVTFYGPGDRILDLIPEEGVTDRSAERSRRSLRALGLNEWQIEALRLMVNEGKELSNADYRQLFNVSQRTATRDLTGLVQTGWIYQVGVKRPYYLVAWLLPLPVTAVIVVLAVALGIGRPDFSLLRALRALATEGASVPSSVPAGLLLVVPIQLLITALLATPILWGEEFGWRGYLQIRLLGQRPLLAAVTIGLIWGVWHYPINLRGYNFPGYPILGLVVFPVSAILLSVIFGWLRLRTGSAWAASLAHAATNAVGGPLITLLFAGGPDSIFVGYLGLLSWLPLGALCAWIVFSGQLGSGMVTPCSGT